MGVCFSLCGALYMVHLLSKLTHAFHAVFSHNKYLCSENTGNRTSYTAHTLCIIGDIDSFSVGDEAKRMEFMALLKTYPQDSMSKEWVIAMVTVTFPTLYIHLWHTACARLGTHSVVSLWVARVTTSWWGLISPYYCLFAFTWAPEVAVVYSLTQVRVVITTSLIFAGTGKRNVWASGRGLSCVYARDSE